MKIKKINIFMILTTENNIISVMKLNFLFQIFNKICSSIDGIPFEK